MGSHQQKSRTWFFVKQAILLAITAILVTFFTIPFVQDVKSALSPGGLRADAKQAETTWQPSRKS